MTWLQVQSQPSIKSTYLRNRFIFGSKATTPDKIVGTLPLLNTLPQGGEGTSLQCACPKNPEVFYVFLTETEDLNLKAKSFDVTRHLNMYYR